MSETKKKPSYSSLVRCLKRLNTAARMSLNSVEALDMHPIERNLLNASNQADRVLSKLKSQP